MRKVISQRLREHMETNNIGPIELASAIGISRVTLYRVLNTSNNIRNSIIDKIANYLGYDIEKLSSVRKQTTTKSTVSKSSIIGDKTDAINAAKDFEYGDDVYKALEAAETLGEINRIMINARCKKFG